MLLSVRHIYKSFGPDVILNNLSLGLERHATLSILGRSGCGKTTFLKILAGLESANSGQIFLDGQDISELPPQKRGVVYLYQEPLLFPHLNVWDNVAFGLQLSKTPAREIARRVDQMLYDIGLEAHAGKMPNQLSGGQRQRVAFGRAIIVNPALLLLDEPFASLDVDLRANMQQLFKTLTARFDITSIFVTHDLKEALLMGDRIAYMKKGALRCYPSREAFIHDSDVGVMDEIAFWSGLLHPALPNSASEHPDDQAPSGLFDPSNES